LIPNQLFGGPARPTKSLIPEVIGVIIREEFVLDRCQIIKVTLDTGQSLDLALLGDAKAKCGDGPWVTGVPSLTMSNADIGTAHVGDVVAEGGLMLYGHDGATEWIAGAWSNGDAGDAVDCPYVLTGSGYDEGAVLHLSTGLVIPKTPSFANRSPWVKEAETFTDSDRICVNRQGEAVAISRWSPM
jgi:hypothetical protein